MSAYTEIAPSDTTPQRGLVTAIFVGGAGAIVVRARGDTADVTLANASAGKWLRLPEPVLFVMATGTTATNLVAALSLSTRGGGR